MQTVIWVITRGGIPAFFFFALVLMLLWNEIVVDQLNWGPTLTYLQVVGIWFLVSFGLSWVGIAARALRPIRDAARRPSLGERIERTIESHVERFEERDDWDDSGDRIERKVKRAFARWADADEGFDWEELGELIERKIRRKVRDWADQE